MIIRSMYARNNFHLGRKAACLCLLLSSYILVIKNADAFPLRPSNIAKHPSSPRTPSSSKISSPLSARRSQWALELSMLASDAESSADGNKNSQQQAKSSSGGSSSEMVPEIFDFNDWEPMDFDDVDEFFDSIDFPGYGDDDDDFYEGTDDPEELLQVLQDMIDNSDQAARANFNLRNNPILSGDEDDDYEEIDEDTLLEILGYDDLDDDEEDETATISAGGKENSQFPEWKEYLSSQGTVTQGIGKGIEDLEKALLGGVVPAEAGVGSGILPGDYGFDPLELATKDYFKQVQNFVLKLVPERKEKSVDETNPQAGAAMPTIGFVGEDERPPALILRDYREAEIRHGRLAMLAAVIWPLQEILDRIFIPESFGKMTVIYGGPTLPFLPLAMTFFMLNLGYLDIYSSEIKENESGDAFLPGECFWDPLSVMEGAPDRMKRNMQEREILNGRAAMIAVAAFIFEEAMTHQPIISIQSNELLFEPAYQVPIIQHWLDLQFGSIGSSSVVFPQS